MGYSNFLPDFNRMSTASEYGTRTNGRSTTNLSRSLTPLSTNLLKNAMSSAQCSSAYLAIALTNDSARSMSPFKSQNAISGSIIQNSAAWRAVLEFSARNVGPNV